MAFDFKKEYREFYLPKNRPELVTVPPVQYVAVRGAGDPNQEGGAYKADIGVLYALAYTIKMSKLGPRQPEGYFDFVVPPLEGFWWQEGVSGVDYAQKAAFQWISCIRLPEFVTPEVFAWAQEEAARKKQLDTSAARLLTVEEGLCVQMMHHGAFDEEPASVQRMEQFLAENGYICDFESGRRHHEIYLTDARRVPPERWKTVIRLPIRKA